MSGPDITSYDVFPYPGHAFPQTHPERLFTLASLFGMKPAPVERCRVLELACGDGGNLIPMAYVLPASEFLGIDLAGTAIARGNGAIDALGLRNITLRQCDLLEFPPDLGHFEYIIAHGIYSWVPAPVRDKVMAICGQHLTPHGVAWISYNCLPGYHVRSMLRDMMRFHTRHVTEPPERVRQARALVKFLVDSQSRLQLYKQFLEEQLERVLEREDFGFYHDELADVNEPVYFYQFVEHAAGHGLQYLAEADFFEMQDITQPPIVRETLAALGPGHLIAHEQYLDFIKARIFRQTLLCRQNVPLNRKLDSDSIRPFLFSSKNRALSGEPNLAPGVEEEFVTPNSATMKTDHPVAKAATVYLEKCWPQRLSFEELLSGVRDLLSPLRGVSAPSTEEDGEVLAGVLLRLYAIGLVQLHAFNSPLTTQVSERPVTSRLARWQALGGNRVTALNHMSIEFQDELTRNLVLLCDGTRERNAILAGLQKLAAESPDQFAAADITPETLEQNLHKLATYGLLHA